MKSVGIMEDMKQLERQLDGMTVQELLALVKERSKRPELRLGYLSCVHEQLKDKLTREQIVEAIKQSEIFGSMFGPTGEPLE